MKKHTALITAMLMLLVTATILTACEREVYYCHCEYMPWSIDEYELFGLTKEQLVSKYHGSFSSDGSSFLGCFNIRFDDAHKVCAVQRYFVGCRATYYGDWLESETEALNYCIVGRANYHDKESIAKLAVAKELRAKITASRQVREPLSQ